MLEAVSVVHIRNRQLNYYGDQSVVATSIENFQASNVASLIRCLYTFGLNALYVYCEEDQEKEDWNKFIADIAIKSPTSLNNAPIHAHCGDVATTISSDENGIAHINVGNTCESLDIPLRDLQKTMRVNAVKSELWHPADEFTEDIIQLKQYTEIENFTDSLFNNIKPAIGRWRFDRNCQIFYQALRPVFKKDFADPIQLTLHDGFQLTLMVADSNVILTTANGLVMLEVPVKEFFEHLRQKVVGSQNFSNPKFLEHDACFQKLGWHGRVYDENNPDHLAPDYKKQPYKTITNTLPINLNCEIPFPDTNQLIVCSDFSAQDAKERLENGAGKGKRDLSVNATPLSVTAYTFRDTYEKLRNNPEKFHRIINADFGKFLQSCFLDMQKEENQQTLKIMLFESTYHSMNLRLLIKGKHDKPIYVVSFFEPNISTHATRCVTDDLSTFETQTLKLYIDGTDATVKDSSYDLFYKNQAPISYALEVSLDSLAGNLTYTERKLSGSISGPITGTDLFNFLIYDLAKDLADQEITLQQIGEQNPTELVEILMAKNKKGVSGLYFALQNGNTKAIKAYGKLLQLFPETEIAELVKLLAAKNEDGMPGLHAALKYGHADAIKAYGKLLQLLPKTEIAELVKLLGAKNEDGIPGLYVALENGNAKAIKAYGKLLRLLPKTEIADLVEILSAKNADGKPGLYLALEYGNAKAIKEYGELLQLLPETEQDELIELIAAKNSDGFTGLYYPVGEGDTKTINAYKEIFQRLSESGRQKLRGRLTAVDAKSSPLLHEYLCEGDKETIDLYSKLFSLTASWCK